jgi:hypothetical protein
MTTDMPTLQEAYNSINELRISIDLAAHGSYSEDLRNIADEIANALVPHFKTPDTNHIDDMIVAVLMVYNHHPSDSGLYAMLYGGLIHIHDKIHDEGLVEPATDDECELALAKFKLEYFTNKRKESVSQTTILNCAVDGRKRDVKSAKKMLLASKAEVTEHNEKVVSYDNEIKFARENIAQLEELEELRTIQKEQERDNDSYVQAIRDENSALKEQLSQLMDAVRTISK